MVSGGGIRQQEEQNEEEVLGGSEDGTEPFTSSAPSLPETRFQLTCLELRRRLSTAPIKRSPQLIIAGSRVH